MKNTIIHTDKITNLESKESAEKLKNDSYHSSTKPNKEEISQDSLKTSNPGLIVGEVLPNEGKKDRKPSLSETGSHPDRKTSKPASKRSQSSSNILTQAPVHSSCRRSSCVPTQPIANRSPLPVPTPSAEVQPLP
jgi:hypothetical protein